MRCNYSHYTHMHKAETTAKCRSIRALIGGCILMSHITDRQFKSYIMCDRFAYIRCIKALSKLVRVRDRNVRRRCTRDWVNQIESKNKKDLKRELIYLINRSTARILGIAHQQGVFENKLQLLMLPAQALRARGLDRVPAATEIITDYENRRSLLLLLSDDMEIDDLLLKTVELAEELDAVVQQRRMDEEEEEEEELGEMHVDQQQQQQQRFSSVIKFVKDGKIIPTSGTIQEPSLCQAEEEEEPIPGPSCSEEKKRVLPRIVSMENLPHPRIILLKSGSDASESASNDTNVRRVEEENSVESAVASCSFWEQPVAVVQPLEKNVQPPPRIEEFYSDISDVEMESTETDGANNETRLGEAESMLVDSPINNQEEEEEKEEEDGEEEEEIESSPSDSSSDDSSADDSSSEDSADDSSSEDSSSSSSSNDSSTDSSTNSSSSEKEEEGDENKEKKEEEEVGGGRENRVTEADSLQRSELNNFIVNSVGAVENQIGGGRARESAEEEEGEGEGGVGGEEEEEEEEDIQPPGYRFVISEEERKYFRRFRLVGRQLKLRIRQPPMHVNEIEWLEGAIRDIHTYLTESSSPRDSIGLTIHSEFFSKGEAWLSFRRVSDFDVDHLWDRFYSVIQSNSDFQLTDSFFITCSIVREPTGRGRIKLTHEYVNKKSILTITNNDNLCLPRSIVAAYVYTDRGELRSGSLHDEWQSVRQERGKRQRELAQILTRKANVTIPAEGCGIREIVKFQAYLVSKGVAMVIHEFSGFARGRSPLFNGTRFFKNSNVKLRYTIHIMHYERRSHYQPILNLTKAACGKIFCFACNVCHESSGQHRCSNLCPRCKFQPPCDDSIDKIYCNYCHRYFFGEICFARHIALTKKKYARELSSTCQKLKSCPRCYKLVAFKKNKSKHVCGRSYCKVCKSMKPYNHLCYMTPIKSRKKDTKTIFIFYDFETCQNKTLEGNETIRIHEPNLCVVHQVCTMCLAEDKVEGICPFCGVREFIFKDDPVKQLVELVTRPLTYFHRILCIAHNARSFDAQFILRYLIEQKGGQLPELILNGSKIISMRVGKTSFLDSLNYFHMPLSASPKAFGLPDSLTKGTFPHLFNKPENANYIGDLPDKEYYSPDTMKPLQREKFLEWYEETKNSGYQFDFEKEIVSYCQLDVHILRKACLALRSIFLEVGNVCPFEEAYTIASSCSKLFRRNFLQSDRIGIIPKGGYRYADRQSHIALEWLLWKEHVLGLPILHAARDREFRLIENLIVDGYYEVENTKHVLQFHGCFYHGCPRCFTTNRDKSCMKGAETMDSLFEKTLNISNRIRSAGYVLEEIWECEFVQMKKANVEIQNFISNHPLLEQTPLEPRDAFYGERTGNTVTLYEVGNEEQIRDIDVCSLYPSISKYGKFPVGHPKVYVGDECDILLGPSKTCLDQVEGLIKCTVLPPRDLYLPVLPVKMHNHLLFILCRTCGENMFQDDCPHDNVADRQIVGTWVVDEVKKAVQLGYKVLKVHEIWQFEITQYDHATKTGGHFVEYINSFLKFKQEASDWPDNAMTEEAKDQYIAEYADREGIALDKEKISSNPGFRAVAKLCLNSFWGKFGQRDNLPKTEVVNSRGRLAELLANPAVEVCGLLPVNHKILYVSWRYIDEALAPSSLTNVIIAAYTTAQARLKLYSYLEKLDRRVLYYDTDSCIYLSTGTPGEYEPTLGCFLGDMTDELSGYGEGSYIRAFASGGPKFYAYVVRKPDQSEVEICKVKGITLNFETSSKINFSEIRSFAIGERNEPITVEYDAIRRTPFHQVISKREKKMCKPTAYKRRRNGEFGTLPYGMKTNS